jgi:hypothetical protein
VLDANYAKVRVVKGRGTVLSGIGYFNDRFAHSSDVSSHLSSRLLLIATVADRAPLIIASARQLLRMSLFYEIF